MDITQLSLSKLFSEISMPVYYIHDLQVPTTLLFFKESMLFYRSYRCSIEEVHATRYPDHLGYAFPKLSPHLEFVNYHLLRLMEEGTLRLLNQRHLLLENQAAEKGCLVADHHQDIPLSLTKLVSLFAILGLGCLASAALFSAEGVLGRMRSGGGVTRAELKPDPITSLYKSGLQRIAHKWGISNKAKFEEELEELLRLRHNLNVAPS